MLLALFSEQSICPLIVPETVWASSGGLTQRARAPKFAPAVALLVWVRSEKAVPVLLTVPAARVLSVPLR